MFRGFLNILLSWSISCLFLPEHFFHVRSVQIWLVYEMFEIDRFQVNSLKKGKLINFGTTIWTSTPGDKISLWTRPRLVFVTKITGFVTTIGIRVFTMNFIMKFHFPPRIPCCCCWSLSAPSRPYSDTQSKKQIVKIGIQILYSILGTFRTFHSCFGGGDTEY